jgi:perosamine synthetase
MTISKLALFGGEKIRKYPFPIQNSIGKEELKEVTKVLAGGKLSGFIGEYCPEFHGGPNVQKIEARYAEYFGSRYAISVNSATSALQTALAALGVGLGDEVLVTPYTMSASATAILMQNACPVFVDIDEKTFNIDANKIEEKITDKTKAIVVVDLFGQPADFMKIRQIADKHNLKIIEDGAQAANATYYGKKACTLGDIGILSLNIHKIIHSGEGGILFTDNEELSIRCQLIRNHGENAVDHFNIKDISHTMGLNFRMTEIEAGIANAQLDKLDHLYSVRNHLAEYLTERLTSITGIIPPYIQDNTTSAYYLYSLKIQPEILNISRETYCKALMAEGIPVEEGYVKPLYLQSMYQQRKGRVQNPNDDTCGLCGSKKNHQCKFNKGICPIVEEMHFSKLFLGDFCHDPLTTKDMDDIANAFYKISDNMGALIEYENRNK